MKKALVLIIVGIFILGFSGGKAQANGGTDLLLVFTEDPSGLSVTLQGFGSYGTVTPYNDPNLIPGSHAWLWTPPLSGSGNAVSNVMVGFNNAWLEPDASGINFVDALATPAYEVVSDFPGDVGNTNGSIVNPLLSVFYENEANPAIFAVQFIDNGDAASKVPEPATMLLYGLGFAGAGLYRRIRRRK